MARACSLVITSCFIENICMVTRRYWGLAVAIGPLVLAVSLPLASPLSQVAGAEYLETFSSKNEECDPLRRFGET